MSRWVIRLAFALGTSLLLGLGSVGLPITADQTKISSPAASDSTSVSCVPRSATNHYVIRTNAAGQTYGSSANADPDLVAVTLRDSCTSAYVLREDVIGPEARTPAEALAHQESDEGRRGRDVPAYSLDGTTVLGTFHVNGSASS